MTLAVAILAAGQSRRLGQDKQLVQWQGKTLLQRAVDTAAHLQDSTTLVTLGVNADLHWSSLSNKHSCTRLDVQDSNEGMSASMRAIAHCLNQSESVSISAVLIMLVDQYRVDVSWLNALNDLHGRYPDQAIASNFSGLRAVPAIFPRKHFQMLAELKGDRGARDWLRNQDDVIDFASPSEPGDVDSLKDLIDLQS
jgi:molybdenum cofactor cytidylyltransferase